MVTAANISNRIIDAILRQELEPNVRLGEQKIATLFGCSRTIVREAMVELATRGIVAVSPRRGWYLVDVTVEKARELYEAREIIETGLLRNFARQGKRLDPEARERLRDHLGQQARSIAGGKAAQRSYLLGNFHVCLAECLGNGMLAAQLRDLTVLTTLFTTRYQTDSDARRSYDEHVAVVEALMSGDAALAEGRMRRHLGTWEEKVHVDTGDDDPLSALRDALLPADGILGG